MRPDDETDNAFPWDRAQMVIEHDTVKGKGRDVTVEGMTKADGEENE